MGYVYLLCELGSDPEKYKIGITTGKIEDRIKQLQTGCSGELHLIKTFESDYFRKIESTLHREYSHLGVGGGTEWFQLNPIQVFAFEDRCKILHENFEVLHKSENPFFK